MLAKDIMTTQVLTVRPEASVREVAELLVSHKISGVPVVAADGRLCGIVSEGDLLYKETGPAAPDGLCILGAVIYYHGLREYRQQFNKLAAVDAQQIMTSEVVTAAPDTEVREIAKKMRDQHIKRVPIVDAGGKLVGIVRRQDIVRMLLADEE